MANLTNEKGKFAIAIYDHFTVYLLMPVVTLQSLKVIGRLEVGKLGRGPHIL